MGASLQSLRAELATLEAQLTELQSTQRGLVSQVDLQLDSVDLLAGKLEALPEALRILCPAASAPAPIACPPQEIQRVIMQDNKMVLGELERVWLQPPGVSLTARIDSSAAGNSVQADELVEFERDGEQWVRFRVRTDAGNGAPAERAVERVVLRYVRTFVPGDNTGTRRPVVALNVRLGDVHNNYEFTVTDRVRTDHQMVLGRSFLTDTALIDVGQQFVQPPFRPRGRNQAEPVEP